MNRKKAKKSTWNKDIKYLKGLRKKHGKGTTEEELLSIAIASLNDEDYSEAAENLQFYCRSLSITKIEKKKIRGIIKRMRSQLQFIGIPIKWIMAVFSFAIKNSDLVSGILSWVYMQIAEHSSSFCLYTCNYKHIDKYNHELQNRYERTSAITQFIYA